MTLFGNGKTFIMVFIITLVLGYYLGIAISGVVDQRIKDTQIRLPKPKNNIIIHVSEKPKKVDVIDNSKKIETFMNYKIKPKKSIIRRKKINILKTKNILEKKNILHLKIH